MFLCGMREIGIGLVLSGIIIRGEHEIPCPFPLQHNETKAFDES